MVCSVTLSTRNGTDYDVVLVPRRHRDKVDRLLAELDRRESEIDTLADRLEADTDDDLDELFDAIEQDVATWTPARRRREVELPLDELEHETEADLERAIDERDDTPLSGETADV